MKEWLSNSGRFVMAENLRKTLGFVFILKLGRDRVYSGCLNRTIKRKADIVPSIVDVKNS